MTRPEDDFSAVRTNSNILSTYATRHLACDVCAVLLHRGAPWTLLDPGAQEGKRHMLSALGIRRIAILVVVLIHDTI